MPRRGAFRNQRIDDKLCVLLEERMLTEHRRGSLNAYIEEILDKWVSGLLSENDSYKAEIQRHVNDVGDAEMERLLSKRTTPSRKVHRVGPVISYGRKGEIKDDEGKRKAS